MNLKDLLLLYVDEHEHGIKDSYKQFLYACTQCYSSFLGKEADISDLNRHNVNRYVDWMVLNRARCTVKSQRTGLLVLWRFAASRELCEQPVNIRCPKKVQRRITTWTRSEVSILRDFCLDLRGSLKNGIPKSIYFASLVQAGYETGFRLADQLSLERDWIRPSNGEGCLTIIEGKTGKESRRMLTKGTLELIDLSMTFSPDRRLIWPLWARRESFYDAFGKIVLGAGIRQGTYRYLRRTAATDVDIQNPGFGQEFLNHSSPQITKESYLDRWQTNPVPLRVTPLEPCRAMG